MKNTKKRAFGGLQQKIFIIILSFVLMVGFIFVVAIAYQTYLLKQTITSVNEAQQEAIADNTSESMTALLISSLYENNGLHARVLEEIFNDLENNVTTMQLLAVQLFENSEQFPLREVKEPDISTAGELVVDVLWADGVDYKNSKDLGIAAHMSEAMLAMYRTSDTMQTCYFGLADGTYLLLDVSPEDKFDENGRIKPFPVTERPWYKGAIEANGLWFSDIYEDAFSGKFCITCSAPVYAKGRLIGVVGVDVFLDGISGYISDSDIDEGFMFVVNNEGHVIFASNNNEYFKVAAADAIDLRASENDTLALFISESLKSEVDPCLLELDGDKLYLVSTQINPVGWVLVSAAKAEMVEGPTEAILTSYREINESASAEFLARSSHLGIGTILVLVTVLVIGAILVIRFTKKVVKPLESMVAHIKGLSGTNLQFMMADEYRTKDEIELLADSFAELSERTVKYIKDIQLITAERERVGTELKLATDIQSGLLPSLFPAFPDRPEIDIYALMNTAKEVGGDFYDFFLIDNDHLALVVADVSGKGVPAALFMMSTKILVNVHTMMGGTPAEILDRVNKQICANNKMEMFVTVWLGILEISTGRLSATNAGHEYPIIKTNSGYELMKDEHGPPLGIRAKVKFVDYEITLKKGESLFVYTDGVAEAKNVDGKLFGTERTVEALNSLPDTASQEEVLKGVHAAVDDFAKGAEQFDDITMLGIKYFGTTENT